MFWTYRQRLNSDEIVRTNMKRLCGFAVSHIVHHYFSPSHRVVWSVSLSVAVSVCHASEPCKNGWNDEVAICVPESGWPKEPRITWGPDGSIGRGNFEEETGKPLYSIGTLRGHLCKNCWTDRGAVLVVGSHGPKASCVTFTFILFFLQ